MIARTEVKERPILFSGEMVRAILDGRKTQTRRVVREDLGNRGKLVGDHVRYWRRGEEDPTRWCGCDGLGSLGWVRCPYGEPGDRLWVRETWCTGSALDEHSPSVIEEKALDAGYNRAWGPVLYVADDGRNSVPLEGFGSGWGRKRSSIHMPRWASRITLEVVRTGVERLQDISDTDIIAEGVTVDRVAAVTGIPWGQLPTLRDAWRLFWDFINGKGAYDLNPWVWCVEFKRVQS